MTFGNFSKSQLWFEPVNGSSDLIGIYKPSASGILKHIRLRYVISEAWAQDFAVTIKVTDYYDPTAVIDTSNVLTLDDFTLPASGIEFHQGWIRFDFPNDMSISEGNSYKLYMNFSATTFNTNLNNFVAFAIDYPFRTNETTGNADPSLNGYADAQIYIERLYNDFVVR